MAFSPALNVAVRLRLHRLFALLSLHLVLCDHTAAAVLLYWCCCLLVTKAGGFSARGVGHHDEAQGQAELRHRTTRELQPDATTGESGSQRNCPHPRYATNGGRLRFGVSYFDRYFVFGLSSPPTLARSQRSSAACKCDVLRSCMRFSLCADSRVCGHFEPRLARSGPNEGAS